MTTKPTAGTVYDFSASNQIDEQKKFLADHATTEKHAWPIDDVRKRVEEIATKRHAGTIDTLAESKEVDSLSKFSGWKVSDIKRQLKENLTTLSAAEAQEASKPLPTRLVISEEDRELGMTLAKEKDLFAKFHSTLESIGCPSSPEFAKSVFMSQLARFLPKSTGHIFTGSSSSGKSFMQEQAARLMPQEDSTSITSMSANAMYYQDSLKGRRVAFGEIKPVKVGEDDYFQTSMRQLISENRITREIVEKNENGKLEKATKVAEGPCSFTATTTISAQGFHDELVNRCYWIRSDDSEETTKKVLAEKARRAVNPLLEEKDTEVARQWQAYNSLLRPLPVAIPYAESIIPTNNHVTARRLVDLLFNYIKCSALAHQHNRKIVRDGEREYIESEPSDYKIACELLQANAPRTLDTCSDKARELFERAKKTYKVGEVVTLNELTKLLSTPRETMRRHLGEWINAGIASETENTYGGKSKKYRIEEADVTAQDLGLVPFETAFAITAT